MKLLSKSQLITRLISNRKFRDAFVYEHIRTGIPFQLRSMREERGWTQNQLAEAADKPRNVITRLEDPNYGKLTLRTLIEISSALNVGLLVRFVPFTRLVREYDDLSPKALSAMDITSPREVRALKMWASAKDKEAYQATNNEGKALVGTTLKLPFEGTHETPRAKGNNIVHFPSMKTGTPKERPLAVIIGGVRTING